MISMDLLYPGRLIREGVERAVSDVFKPAEIFLAASHTHSAPAVDVDKPRLGAVDSSYVDEVVMAIERCVRDAVVGQIDATDVAVCSTYASSAINRRLPRFFRLGRTRLRWREFDIGPNPHGPSNETVTALVLGPSSAPLAVVWNYACHPTSAPRADAISAHFPGVVRDRVRKLYGLPKLPVLYLQGFSGDLRPPSVERITTLRTLLRRLLLGPRFGPFSSEQYEVWVSDLATKVEGALTGPNVRLDGGLRVARAALPTEHFVVGARSDATTNFHAVSIGTVVLVGVSAEVVTEYSQRLQSCFPGYQAIGVGCIDETFGYAPTRSMLGTGGYEDDVYCAYFGLHEVAPGIELAMMRGFQEVATRLARPKSMGSS
jgi:neutral ceramidase